MSRSAHPAEPRSPQPTVSVVVVSYNSPLTLELCLASLSQQRVREVLVVDCSDRDPAAALGGRFPQVRFRHLEHKSAIPQMRWEGIRESCGEIVAITESWMVPCGDWVAALEECHRRHPSAAVVGGPVGFPLGGQTASALAWADYLSEYGHYLPLPQGTSEADCGELPGPNCSYKRGALDECHELWAQGAWEPFVHAALKQKGYRLLYAGRALVRYHRPVTAGQALRQRYHYGRGFAAERSRGSPLARRMLRAALAPAVPPLMLVRLWRVLSRQPGSRRRLREALGWLLALYSAWAWGECCGYLFGPGSSRDRVF